MYALFLLASWLVPRTPRWFLRCVPDLAGPLVWLLNGPARRQATRNAAYVLRLDAHTAAAQRRQLRRVVRGMFRQSVRNYLDALLLPALDYRDILAQMSIAGQERIDEALALGKGALLISAHFGPFEHMSQWFAARNYQVTIPVERLKDERVLRLMLKLRNSSGSTYVPLGGSAPMRAIVQALRKNQIVLITADRAVEGESVVRNFFGAPARLPIGPVNLSLRTGAPLIGAFGWRDERGHIVAEFTHLTLALPDAERQQVEVVEDALIARLEQVISAHPEQWAVLAPVWVESGEALAENQR